MLVMMKLLKKMAINIRHLQRQLSELKELEKEIEQYKTSGSNTDEQIAQLQAEISRLKVYEENQEYFEQLKKEFDDQVVFNEKCA